MTGFPEGDKALELGPEYYDEVYRTSAKYLGSWQDAPWRHVVWYPALLLAEGDPIYDIGCGTGQFAEMCEAYGAWYTEGIDTSPVAIEQARKRCAGPFTVFDGLKCRPHDGTTVTCLEVLEHIYEDVALLKRLPQSTYVVASVPNFQTKGHVRWFKDEDQVRQRYEAVLDIDTIITEKGAGSNRLFIFRGVRR